MRNERLARLMREAGFITPDGSLGLKQFARAAKDAAARNGSVKNYTHTYVVRWLDGIVPRDEATRQAITGALGRRLGRTVGQDELGFEVPGRVAADIGLRYAASVPEAVSTVTLLWQADLDQVHTLTTTPPNVAVWNEASLSWLVEPGQPAEASTAGVRVGPTDVARVSMTTEMFGRLDNQFGGGHARRALLEFLRGDVAGLLRGSYTDETGRKLFRAAAEATLVDAWMSYDAGLHGVAQRYFLQALKLAEAGNDRLLAASVLDAMSHQATYLGWYREAANLARSARMGTAQTATPTLTAHFHAMEARALARIGDAAGCDRAMSDAVRHFERRRPDEDPEWFQYFDDAELAAELGHCNRDLGRPADASTYAAQAIADASGQYTRSDFFAVMVLAHAHLDKGDDEEACRIALHGLDIGENLRSARCASYVEEFRQLLAKRGNSAIASDFTDQARGKRLWTPSS